MKLFSTYGIKNMKLKKFVNTSEVPAIKHTLINGKLFALYDAEQARNVLRKRVVKHKEDNRYNRFIDDWLEMIEELEGIIHS